jgi:hypothetical protein
MADSKGKAALGSGAPGTQPAELAVLQHKKVINAAYFSPITGEAGTSWQQRGRLLRAA